MPLFTGVTLLYSSDAGHGDDVALVNNPISEGEAA
jgi:hypothetical protein